MDPNMFQFLIGKVQQSKQIASRTSSVFQFLIGKVQQQHFRCSWNLL